AEYDGFGWFRKEFTIDRKSTDKRLALVFETVDDNADVWLNGKRVGSHRGYGELFWFDVTDFIKTGAKNILTVRIEDTGGPGGINGSVYMVWFGEEKDFLKSPLAELTAVKSPDWVREAILYEIFVRDFSEEGTFNGVVDRLDDLKELGIDCIWLMPIHPVGKEKRKGEWGSPYSVVDYYSVTPDFGTLEDFRNLVQETHRRGMKIILDMVLNHSAWDSPLLTQHPDWYTRNEQGEVISPNKDWSDVADFNYDSQELRKYMVDMLLYWVRDFDVDGFRFDVAELVPLDFWEKARTAVREVKPEILFLAEGDDPKLHLSAFDLTYSWNVWSYVLDVCNERKTADNLKRMLINETYRYPRNSLRMRFVENHDKRRVASEIPRETLELAHAFIYTIPGVPLLYNGEEVALTHRLELFDKDPIKWNKGENEFREFMVRLGQLKHSNPDLSALDWEFIDQSFPSGVIGWKRGASTLCFANFSAKPVEFVFQKENSASFKVEFAVKNPPQVRDNAGQILITLQPWDLVVVREN
ncbi:MAG: hypothetical protein GXO92_00380, partial [FCB group bacterium]|nr:hypothetical protein [FCB group bacterium]